MIADKIADIKKRIIQACAKCGRKAQEIEIVAVTKGRPVGQILEAVSAGISNIGENRIQEALSKYYELQVTSYELRIKWHLVGHLQSNKVKDAVGIFDLIHSVDSLKLASQIDKEAAKINKVQDILIQVNTSGEETKFGLKPEDTPKVIKEVSQLKNINIKGLMTIAPLAGNQEETRFYFRVLRLLRNKVNSTLNTQYAIQTLSMGMTDDFEVALEEGATMLRLGRAIFEV